MTTDRKSLIFSLAVVSWQKNEYPGIAKLVSRLVWEDRRLIHSPKSESPEALGTVACGENSPVEKIRQNRA